MEFRGGRDQSFGDRDGFLACLGSILGGAPFDDVSKGGCVGMSGGRDQFFGESGVLVICLYCAPEARPLDNVCSECCVEVGKDCDETFQ